MPTLRVPALLSELETVRGFVARQAAARGLDPAAVYDVVLAVDELLTNIIVHGYRGRPGSVALETSAEAGALRLVLRDSAPPFDPTGVALPETRPAGERRAGGGMGILLARRSLDALTHRALPGGGNELTLVKTTAAHNHPEERTMELTVSHAAGRVPVTILAIHGSLDASCFERLIERARELYASGTRALLLDMSAMTFMGSSGLVALRSVALIMRGVQPPAPDGSWEAFRALEAGAGARHERVKLLRPHANIRRTLEITGMDEAFEVYDDRRAAVESFA